MQRTLTRSVASCYRLGYTGLVLRADYTGQNCSIARALELVGERWTILILRDVFLGTYRFEKLQNELGIARNVLQTRLERLVEEGILRRVQYEQRPPRFEYRLTEAGRDLFPVVVSLLQWGDRWTAGEAGPPLLLVHEPCGQPAGAVLACSQCGEEITLENVHPELGPGAA